MGSGRKRARPDRDVDKTIKQRINEAVLARLNELSTESSGITQVRENNDLTAVGNYQTELIVIPGPEAEQSRDCTGQTCQFDVHVKIFVPHPALPSPRRRYSYPELTAAVIEKLEAMPALDGLATVVQGAEELPYLKTGLSHIKGPFVRVRLEYRRKRGNPYETYAIGQQEKDTCVTQQNPTMAIY